MKPRASFLSSSLVNLVLFADWLVDLEAEALALADLGDGLVLHLHAVDCLLEVASLCVNPELVALLY